MKEDRRQEAYRIRVEAAGLARGRAPVVHTANGDEQRFASINYAISFTKGLPHDAQTGLVDNPASFEAFRRAIDDGFVDAFTLRVPVSAQKHRQWEAPTAGVVYDLQGPDSQAGPNLAIIDSVG